MAYSLAVCDVAVSNHGFIAAEFLANRGHSGQWADRAIAALLVDLRHLGPHAIGTTITTSLSSAYEEVTAGDTDNAAELEEAFGELADRLSGMFAVGNQRDRVVVRCVIEEGLKFVVPASAPTPTRLPFLMLGLAAFIPKLSTTDARSLMEPLNAVVAVVNEEDELYAPLFEFVNRIAARARGATGLSAATGVRSGGGGGGKRASGGGQPQQRRRSGTSSAGKQQRGRSRTPAAAPALMEEEQAESSDDDDDDGIEEEEDDAGAGAAAAPVAADEGVRMYGRRRR